MSDLSGFSMLELFRVEVETQMDVLSRGLVELESQPESAALLKELMRAAHSIKGAARIVNYDIGVRIAHAMEDRFVAAQEGQLFLGPRDIDSLLCGVDLITQMSTVDEPDLPAWEAQNAALLEECINRLSADEPDIEDAVPSQSVQESPAIVPTPAASEPTGPESPAPETDIVATSNAAAPSAQTADRALRITAENLNRLLGLAGESLLATRWLETFGSELLRMKRYQQVLARSLQRLYESAADTENAADLTGRISESRNEATVAENYLSKRIDDFELFQRVFTGVSSRLYQVVLDCRMRPFADVAQGLQRMVRDVARGLGKEARLEIVGLATTIDRDILDRLEAPLSHILRNAVDHGIETPEERIAAGKQRYGIIRLEAGHSAGTLLIEVADDGRGIDTSQVKRAIVERRLTSEELAERMSDAELFEFLFLPSFTLKSEVTEISGRGVGLDAVQSMIREVGGELRIKSKFGMGTSFQLLLPLTRSVLRTLVVDINGEPYAFPLGKVHSVTKLSREQIESAEGRQHFRHQGQHVGLVVGHQILGLDYHQNGTTEYPVIVLEDHGRLYGILVDKLLDERELVVLPLDRRLGKVPNISAAALLPDRSPILIFDTADMIRSIENLISGERLHAVMRPGVTDATQTLRRVLVVDDSLTVRELERKLLTGGGYEVETAVDGIDGWNAVRTGHYDLVVTDVDMPRMDGIELVGLIRKHARLKALPVIIVSYKDRPEDRERGLDAGADYYLTKSSFQDETLLRVVHDLIGAATE